jgi:hypothetical protein
MAIFQQARAKLNWANNHIADLDTRINLLQQRDVATVEIDPRFGNEVIKHDIADEHAIRDIALMAGDAVHNLRCALDYAWIETVTLLAPSSKGKFTKFPVYPTHDSLKAALCGNKVDQVAPKLFDVILTEIKPYEGGNFAIWPIHRLDIRDKHRLLIPVIYYSSFRGIETQDETGEIRPNGFTMATNQQPPWYIPIPCGAHVKSKGQASISVMFEYESAGFERHIRESLKVYSCFILRVVETLEALI